LRIPDYLNYWLITVLSNEDFGLLDAGLKCLFCLADLLLRIADSFQNIISIQDAHFILGFLIFKFNSLFLWTKLDTIS